jgi:serine/threonine-protein kinase
MQEQDEIVERAQARVGQMLRGKWRLDRLLGVGGMAAVYAATHRNGNVGAVKMLHPELSADTQATTRFSREGYVANKVRHPGAVAVLDDDVTEDGSAFLVMELLDGESVASIAARRPKRQLEVAEALEIADALLDVLAAAHETGVVHRDLKPDNLFLTTRGELKVLDFGIARLREAPGSAHATTSGTILGTPAFLPPEQAQGDWHRIDGRTDLWAVGATVFQLLTGRTVHEAPNLLKMMHAAMTKVAPPLATILADAPAPVCALVDRALAFERDDRWPDARAMQLAVRDARAQLGHAGDAATATSGPISIATIATLSSERPRGADAPTPAMAQGAAAARSLAGSTSTPELAPGDRAAPLMSRKRRRILAVVALGVAWATTAILLVPRAMKPAPAVDAAPTSTGRTNPAAAEPAAAEPVAAEPASNAPLEPAAGSTSASPPEPRRAASAPPPVAGPRATVAREPAGSASAPAIPAPSAPASTGGNVESSIRDRK